MIKDKPASIGLLVLVLCATIIAGCTHAVSTPAPEKPGENITFIDSSGKEITLPGTAERIISTNSDCTEMIIAIGAADRIVGVTDTVMNSPLLRSCLPENVASVGSWQNPDIEKIMTLKPDVVICYSYASKPKNIDQLQLARLKIVYLDCYKTNAVASDARILGHITGEEARAEEYARFLDGCLAMVKANTSKLTDDKKPTVYWESYTAYSTVGKNSGGDLLINISGGTNIAGLNSSTYPKVSQEWVVGCNPAYVFKMVAANNITSSQDLADSASEVLKRPGMEKTDAAKKDHTYAMSGSIAFGARSVIGAIYMAKIMHPEQYASIDPQSVLHEYAIRFLPGSDQGFFIYPEVA